MQQMNEDVTWKTQRVSESLTDKTPFILYSSSPFSSTSLSSQSSSWTMCTESIQNTSDWSNFLIVATKEEARNNPKENRMIGHIKTNYLIKVQGSFRNNADTGYSRIMLVIMMMPLVTFYFRNQTIFIYD